MNATNIKLFENLPIELCHNIIQHLPHIARGNCSMVCKLWNTFLDQNLFWHELEECNFWSNSPLEITFPLAEKQTIKNYIGLYNAATLQTISEIIKKWADSLIENQHRILVGLFPASLKGEVKCTFRIEAGYAVKGRQWLSQKKEVIRDYVLINPTRLPKTCGGRIFQDSTWNMSDEQAPRNTMDKYGSTKLLWLFFDTSNQLPAWKSPQEETMSEAVTYLKSKIETLESKNQKCVIS